MWPSTSYSSSWRFLRGSSFRSFFLQLGAKPPPALIPMDQLLQSSSPKRSQISQQHVGKSFFHLSHATSINRFFKSSVLHSTSKVSWPRNLGQDLGSWSDGSSLLKENETCTFSTLAWQLGICDGVELLIPIEIYLWKLQEQQKGSCFFSYCCTWFLGEVGGPEADRRRLVDVEEQQQQQQQQHQMNEEQTDHLRSLYSQHLMSAASASAYGFVGLLMGFVNKVCVLLFFSPFGVWACLWILYMVIFFVFAHDLWDKGSSSCV